MGSTSAVQTNRVIDFCIYKSGNNLDKIDNLDSIPEKEAVYGIFGRINGRPANCRHIGETANLRNAIKMHFAENESKECLKQFMQSIKIKTINYELLPGSNSEERLAILRKWKEEFNPNCTEELNEIH